MNAKNMSLGAIVVAVALISGCSVTPKRAYDGPELVDSQVAKIRTYAFNTLLGDVDRKNLFPVPDQRLMTDYVHVRPGRHTVKILYRSNAQLQSPGLALNLSEGELELIAVAGHVYVPRSEVVGTQVRFWLEDWGTDYESRCPNKANILVQTQRSATPAGC